MTTPTSNKALETLAEDVSSLWVSRDYKIPVLEHPPTSLHFLRDFVSVSRPCIIRNAIQDESGAIVSLLSLVNEKSPSGKNVAAGRFGERPASLGNHAQFTHQTKMKVAVTPDGHGDCIRNVESVGPTFVEPFEVEVSLETLLQKLAEDDDDERMTPATTMARVFPVQCRKDATLEATKEEATDVYYYSRQNDCLRNELPHVWEALSHVLPDSYPWAEQAFGTGPPDAVNLWLGNQCAVSSMHKDHYENLFLVLAGEKVFTLCPPSDVPFLYERCFPHGAFQKDNESSEWYVEMKQTDATAESESDRETRIQWIAADVTRRDEPTYQREFPLLRQAHPVTVHVKANELLYLPSLWFHRVAQTQTTLAVNYWYDMRFDSPQWCYFHYLQMQASAENNQDGNS